MLKKLASLLFEEEEDIQVEELDVVEEPEVKASLIAAMNPEPQSKSIVIQKLDLTLEPEPIDKPKSSFIEHEPVVEKDEPASYEFRPVMSPMFGISERDKQKVVKRPVEAKPQFTPSNPSSRINTIISPIYGDLKQDELRVEVDRSGLKIAYEHQDLDEVALENMDLTKILHVQEEDEAETMPSVTEDVDVLVSDVDEPEEDNDIEAHQFSLFDDGDSVKL